MSLNAKLAKYWNSIRDFVITDVPANLEECESCREVDCTQARWEVCARRLAGEEEALGASPVCATGRTEELPKLPSSREQPDVVPTAASRRSASSGD